MSRSKDTIQSRHTLVLLGVPVFFALVLLVISLILNASDSYSWQPVYSASLVATSSSSHTSGIMIIGGALLVLWAASLYIRCTDLEIRRYFVWIAALCVLWLLDVVVKYMSINDLASSMLWYFYYVPMGLIPLLCLFIALRMAFYREAQAIRVIRIACTIVTLLLIFLVLTNNLHYQVFSFDFADPDWERNYSYGWVYWTFSAWTIGMYVVFFGLLFRISHLRLRGLFVPAIIIGLLAVVYAGLYVLRVGNIFTGNFSLTYIIMLVACIELMFRFGLLPSFSKYREAFDGMPFDTKILSSDLEVVTETQNAAPLSSDLKPELKRFVDSDEMSLGFRTSAHPDHAFEVVRQRGSIALFTEDRSSINAQRKKLEKTLEATRAHIAVLENSVAVESELYRLSSERELLDAIDEQLGSTVDTICKLLDSISDKMAPDERKHTLTFVRLLVGYCKRMGGFVLEDAEKSAFDAERLGLVLGDTAADARASGISCASFVGFEAALCKQSVLFLYNCMFDVLIIAFQHAESTVMFNILDRDEKSVEFTAVLEADAEKEIAGSETAELLRVSLSAYEMPYDLAVDEDVLRVSVLLPKVSPGEGGQR